MPEREQEFEGKASKKTTSSHELNTLSREITRQLTRRIVDEVYPPGSRLPPERELAAEFGVNRHVIREALKRLEALGLVSIRQGSGVRVEDFQFTGGTELFRSLVERADGSLDLNILRDMFEFRAYLVSHVVRLAARNRTDAEMKKLKELVEERRNVLHDLKKLNKINAQLFQWMAAATHNKISQLVFNTLGKLVVELRPLVKVHPENLPRIQQILEQLVLAIEQQDEELAALLGERHTNLLRRVVRQFFEEYQSSSSRDPTKETPKEV